MVRGKLTIGLLARGAALLAALGLLLFVFLMPHASAVQRTQFDHLTTGYELRGFHRDLSCEYCHLQGVFKGTPRTCVGCHTMGTRVNSTPRPVTHILTQDSCEACHTQYNFLPIVHMDHLQVRGTCFSCHNGVKAMGKNPGHIASDNNCDACHTTNAFTPVRVEHNSINMMIRAGVNGGSTCRTCHSGVRAATTPRNHVPTTQDCGACHGTLSWSPARFNHTGLVANCQSCHNGGGATGKVANHMTTSLDCSTCHHYPNWSSVTFAHTSAEYPGEHRGSPACTACHTTNTDKATWQFAAYRPGCGGCHANSFKPEAHPKTVEGMTYNLSELQNCSGACHIYTDAKLTTISKARPAGHHKVADGAFH
ncbi:MAG TPA: cytochrome c3 family protein [Steroidobacteraceae bacterium]|nr:cytochrome c3 family protein [Steroidobacteraceae bacterium]